VIVVAARTFLRVALVTVGLLLILLALLTIAARLALPLVAGQKHTVEARLSDYLERPVTIGELDLAWRTDGPRLRLGNVALQETSTRGVRFDELLVDVDLMGSLLGRTLVVDELTLVGADLTLDYAGGGRFRLHGAERRAVPAADEPDEADEADEPDEPDKPAGPGEADEVDEPEDRTSPAPGRDERGLDVVGWLLDAGKVGLLDTRLTVLDASGERRLVVSEIDVSSESEGDEHRLRLRLVLPPELGGTLEAGIDLRGRSGALARSAGSVYARGSGLRLGVWRTLRAMDAGGADGASAATDASLAALARLDGEAQLEFWGSWSDGAMRTARVRVDARDVALLPGQGGEAGQPLLDLLSADLAYRDDAPGWTVEADRVELVAGQTRTVLTDLDVGRGARADGDWRVAAGGERLPLALVTHVANALRAASAPPDNAVNAVNVDHAAGGPSAPLLDALDAIVGLDASGALVDWRARVALDGGAPALSFIGDIDALSLAPHGELPGLVGLDGRLHLVDGRGTLELRDGEDGLRLVRDASELLVDTLDAAVDIDVLAVDHVELAGRVALARESLDLDADVALTLASGRSPHVDAQTRYAVGDIADLPPWLAIIGATPALSAWFDEAFVDGQIENGELHWSGRVADFPHENGRGKLQGSFDVRDGRLAFLPGWPVAELATGRVELDGMTLVGTSRTGRLGEAVANEARATIPDLRRARLRFEGSARSDLQALVDFGRDGPLASVLGEVLAAASGNGEAGMDFALEVPLATGAGGPFELDGSLFLDGNDVTFGRADLTLERTRGSIGFDENGVRIGNLRASLFDRPVSIDGATKGSGADAMTELRLGGVLEAADVLAHYGIPLDRFVSGASHWSVTLGAPHSSAKVRRDGVRLHAASDLVGTRMLLPPPLDKGAGDALGLSLSSAIREGEATTLWRIAHGDLRAAIETDADGLRALGARFGDGPVDAPPEPGIRLDGHAPRLAFDGWAEAVATLIDDLPDTDGEPVPILPIHADLTTDALVAGVRSLGPATLRTTTDETYLNATVSNAHLTGSVRYPRAHWDRERVALVRLAYVDKAVIDALDSAPVTDVPAEALDPRLLPAIDAHVSVLGWDALTLRDVTLRARPNPRGLTFEADIEVTGGTTVAGKGSWLLGEGEVVDASRGGSHRSTLDLVVAGEDLGGGLSASGFPDKLAEGRGEIRTTLGWRGPFYLPALEKLEGSLSLDVERGRILPLEVGPARLVGLFALQSLPRRLAFDFSDVTSDGLAFERIAGDIALANGVASVGLVQLTGPVGVVDVAGTSDLVGREHDQRITVLPRVSAALPIIGAIAGGASAGIGVLVAGGFLKAMGLDLDRIGLRRYALRGSWDDPVLEPVDAARRDGVVEQP